MAKLLPHARNARTHSEEQVAQIAASIREFGFVNPVLASAEGTIVAGHGRVQAARLLGIAQVPVVVLDHLSEAERRLLMLADNKIAENAGWDEDLLGAEIRALLDEGLSAELAGFSADEIDKMLAEAGALSGETDEDAVPDEVPEISQLGDVWECGDHVILCGDATNAESYAALLGEGQAAMMFTDPPYNVAYEGKTKRKLTIENDALGESFEGWLRKFFECSLLRCDGAVYAAMSSSELDVLQKAFRDAGGHWSTFIVWVKNVFTLGRSDYQRQYEPILYGWREGAKRHWCGDRNQGDTWEIKKPARNEVHPTMKPVELVERAIANSSKVGDVVLDPFSGSGTTMIACEKRGRKARVMELSPHYVDVAVQRWCEYTGKDARRRSDGMLFSDALMRADVVPKGREHVEEQTS